MAYQAPSASNLIIDLGVVYTPPSATNLLIDLGELSVFLYFIVDTVFF